MRSVVAIGAVLWMLAVGGAGAAGAWSDTGHEAVTLIAWDHLPERTRRTIVTLLEQSTDRRLTGLLPTDGRPLDVRRRAFFVRASGWADLIRKQDGDEPRWHYRNFYWKQESGRAVDLPDLEVAEQNVLERLEFLQTALREGRGPASERAILVAWLLHLVGDVHQPLHCSARVTAEEPRGDRGGNDFELDLFPEPNPERRRLTLHAYWDTILDKAAPRRRREGHDRHVRRAADMVVAAHPRGTLVDRLKPGKFEDWARESLAAAKRAYPPSLQRQRAPGRDYQDAALKVALERVALAGYRLAAMLEDLFGR